MTNVTFALPTIEQVTFKLSADYDHTPVRGNAVVSGDDEYDKKVEDEIIERLDNGDVWAWATVGVTASYKGVTGDADYLGGCCYDSEEDFKKPGGYYDDMKQTAYESLIEELKEMND